MRKNFTMRAGALTLVLTLLTCCFVGGTFAKYVTSGEGTDTARIARFGVAIKAKGATFAQTYAKDNTSITTVTGTTVSSGNADKVIAPGTKGDMATITLSGTPEVAVKVTHKGKLELGDKWMVDGKFYCPLTVKVDEKIIKASSYNSAAEFEKAVNERINGHSKVYEAGTDLSTTGPDALKISWEWPFDAAENDVKDTALGKAAADGNPATATLTIATTVTQID